MKSERIELRVSASDKETIAEAAALEHTTPTEFMRHTVLSQAQRVIARADRTLMPAAQFDALVDALDVPDSAPALARLFSAERRFIQR